jgi:hypothetical protein
LRLSKKIDIIKESLDNAEQKVALVVSDKLNIVSFVMQKCS